METNQQNENDQRFPWDCWLLHLYTASGVYFGIQALLAVTRGEMYLAFQFMMLTIFIDGTDGTIARAIKVSERLPHIDGRTLDDIVDFFTYVIVPVFAMARFGIISDHWAVWAPIVLASSFGFANVNAKTEDDYFLGFPSYWNLVALYLFCFGWPMWVNSLLVLFLAAMVFAPIRFIYPSKTKPYKVPTLLLGIIWGVQTVALVVCPDLLPDWWLPSSLFYPIYYVSLSLYLHRKTAGK
ncbi:MAG: phosphatidylcholine/phosphatidylserine synthase [Candidatus Eremiobacteraeota bacterium]|nr:phosphatidylcholine/phosphatidylserine synthase [Candidatus Eremiobacteraeota bacterium]